jgi:hypothetical protein
MQEESWKKFYRVSRAERGVCVAKARIGWHNDAAFSGVGNIGVCQDWRNSLNRMLTNNKKTTTDLWQFLENNRACARALPWAAKWEKLEDAWEQCPNPDWLLWSLKHGGYEDPQVLLAWACWCVRQVDHLILGVECRQALEASEKFLAGKLTREELVMARETVVKAGEAGWLTAVAAWAARATLELASLRPGPAAKAAAEAAAWASEGRAAWAGTRAAQVEKLRALVDPAAMTKFFANIRDGLLRVSLANNKVQSASYGI